MRFLPAYQAVENMRNGMSPTDACVAAVRRIVAYYTDFELGLVCLDMKGMLCLSSTKIESHVIFRPLSAGNYGAASHGWNFTYAVATPQTNNTAVLVVVPSM